MANRKNTAKQTPKPRYCAKCKTNLVPKGTQFCPDCEKLRNRCERCRRVIPDNETLCEKCAYEIDHPDKLLFTEKTCAVIDEHTGKICGTIIKDPKYFVCGVHWWQLTNIYGAYKNWPNYLKEQINAQQRQKYHERKHRDHTKDLTETNADGEETDNEEKLEEVPGTSDIDELLAERWTAQIEGIVDDQKTSYGELRRRSRLEGENGRPGALFKDVYTNRRAWEAIWWDWCQGYNQGEIARRWGLDRRKVYELVFNAGRICSWNYTKDGSEPEEVTGKFKITTRAKWPGRLFQEHTQLPPGKYKSTIFPGVVQVDNYQLPEPEKRPEDEPPEIDETDNEHPEIYDVSINKDDDWDENEPDEFDEVPDQF